MKIRRMLTCLLAALLFTAYPLSATTLKIATIVPNGTTWMKEFKAASKEINKQTQGRVKLKFFPGGVMGNDQSVLRKIRVGQLHGGALSGGSVAQIYNGAFMYSLPFFFSSYAGIGKIRTILDPLVEAGLEKKGYVVLGISEGGFAYLFSTKPVRNINDLDGQKIWIPTGDKITPRAFENAGVSPISLPVSDVYTGLQTGLIDTFGINPTGAVALQWHTKINYMVDRPLLFIMGFLIVEKKAFNKLKKADQQIVKNLVESTFTRLDASNKLGDEQAKQALLESGIQSVSVNEDAYKEWKKVADTTLNELASEGVINRELLDTLRAELQQ